MLVIDISEEENISSEDDEHLEPAKAKFQMGSNVNDIDMLVENFENVQSDKIPDVRNNDEQIQDANNTILMMMMMMMMMMIACI